MSSSNYSKFFLNLTFDYHCSIRNTSGRVSDSFTCWIVFQISNFASQKCENGAHCNTTRKAYLSRSPQVILGYEKPSFSVGLHWQIHALILPFRLQISCRVKEIQGSAGAHIILDPQLDDIANALSCFDIRLPYSDHIHRSSSLGVNSKIYGTGSWWEMTRN